MNGLTKLKTDIAKLLAPRTDAPTCIQIVLRHQNFVLGPIGGSLNLEPLDPGETGSPRRAVFDLACELPEARVWAAADRKGLRAELEAMLGRGPLAPSELAEAEAEFRCPPTSAQFYRNELRRAVVEAAAAANVPCPAWADRLADDDLPPELQAEMEAWITTYMATEAATVAEEETPSGPA